MISSYRGSKNNKGKCNLSHQKVFISHSEPGYYFIEACVTNFRGWRKDIRKKRRYGILFCPCLPGTNDILNHGLNIICDDFA